MERVMINPGNMASEKGDNLKNTSANLSQSAHSEYFESANKPSASDEFVESAYWWEKVLIAVLFILAIIYTRSAKAANESGVCPPKALQALARICMSKGEYEKAETLIDRALSTAASDEDKSSCLIDKAWIYKNQGLFAQAEQSCLLGLQLQQRVYYADHPYIAYTLRILGSIYQAQGDFPRAAESFDRAISIIRKCHSADDPVVASFEIDAARLSAAEGQFAQAEQQYEKSVAVIIDYYGPDNLYTASVLGDFAKLYYLQGRLDEARAILDYSLDVQRKVYGDDSRLLIPCRLTLAKVLRAEGDVEQAQILLTNAIAVLEKHSISYKHLKDEVRAILADIYANSGKIADAQSACDHSSGA
jgi:tetratricopeptide (TPR) repeat protein